MDSVLSGEVLSVIDGHLDECPLCRQKAADFQELRQSLRAFSRPEITAQITDSIRLAIAAEIQVKSQKQTRPALNAWLKTWLMPSGAGALASVLAAFFVLWTLHSASNGIAQKPEMVKGSSSVLLAGTNPGHNGEDLDLTPIEYAQTRSLIAGESPSINPNGALIALTKSLVRNEMKDDEVVVVADVFGNGLARISEVVEPSRDRRAVAELEQALKSDPAYAPFVPADFDGRSDSMRVVLKIQSVDVKTHLKPKRK